MRNPLRDVPYEYGGVFAWLAYRSVDPETATSLTLNLMVYRAYAVMTNDVLIAIPPFVFMGYLVSART